MELTPDTGMKWVPYEQAQALREERDKLLLQNDQMRKALEEIRDTNQKPGWYQAAAQSALVGFAEKRKDESRVVEVFVACGKDLGNYEICMLAPGHNGPCSRFRASE